MGYTLHTTIRFKKVIHIVFFKKNNDCLFIIHVSSKLEESAYEENVYNRKDKGEKLRCGIESKDAG